MTDQRISVLYKGGKRPALPHTPLLSSHRFGWQGYALEQHRLNESEMPTHSNLSHWVVLQESEGPVDIDSWLDGGSSRRVTRTSGDIGVRASGELAGWRWNGSGSLLVLALEPERVQYVAGELGVARPVELTPEVARRDVTMRHLMSAMRSELHSGCPGGNLLADSLATAIIVHLLRNYAVASPRLREYGGCLPQERLHRVADYIEAHLDEDLSVGQLARVGSASTWHFGKLFKNSTGRTVHQYVLERRIERAKQLLRNDRDTIAQVGLSVGLMSQSHFTMVFRKKVGITPKMFQKCNSIVHEFPH